MGAAGIAVSGLAVYCAGNQVVTRQDFPGHPVKVHEEDGTPCGHAGWNRIGNREEGVDYSPPRGTGIPGLTPGGSCFTAGCTRGDPE